VKQSYFQPFLALIIALFSQTADINDYSTLTNHDKIRLVLNYSLAGQEPGVFTNPLYPYGPDPWIILPESLPSGK
jgi:hypothetical protein